MDLVVIDAQTSEVLPGIPTPMLSSESGQYGQDAYFVANEGDSKDRIPGVWYMKNAPTHVSPDGTYRKVRVVHSWKWEVDLELQAIDPSMDAEDNEPWSEYVFVDAIDEQRARSLAYEKGHAIISRSFPDAASNVTIIRVAKAALQ